MSRARLGLLLVLLVLLGAPAVSRAAGPLDQPGYAKAVTCAACHGASGNSRSEAVPILAGLPPAYFKKAIEDYATGKRPSPEMEPYAKMVRELGVDDVGAYFAAQKRQPTTIPADAAALQRLRTLTDIRHGRLPVVPPRARATPPRWCRRWLASRRRTSGTSSCCSRPTSAVPGTSRSRR